MFGLGAKGRIVQLKCAEKGERKERKGRERGGEETKGKVLGVWLWGERKDCSANKWAEKGERKGRKGRRKKT